MKRQQKWIFNIVISVFIGMLGFFSSSFQSTTNQVAIQFGQPVTMVGTYVSFFAAGVFISLFFSGALADRIGKKRAVIGAVSLMIIGALLLAVSHRQIVTLGGLILIGMGFGPSQVMGSAMLTDENPKRATKWMNISQILYSAGAIIAPLAAVWYYTRGLGTYQDIFLLLAIAFIVLLIPLCFLKYNDAPQSENDTKKPLHPFGVLKSREFSLYALMIFLYLGYESIAPVYIKAYFLQTGSSETLGSTAISLFWLSMIAGRFIGIFMSSKEKLGIRCFSPVVVVAVCILLLAKSPETRLLGALLFGFGCGPVWPMLFVLSSKVFPNRSGSAYAVMMIFSSAAYIVFPVVLGSVVKNLQLTFIGCALLSILVFGFSFFIPKAQRDDIK